MPLVWPSEKTECIPVLIGDGPSVSGPRLGGRSPEGIKARKGMEYLLTLPFSMDPAQELSLFIAGFDEILPASGSLQEPGLIEVLLHSPAPRRASDESASSLSEHPLLLQPAKDDWFINDDGETVVESSHKLGGRPYFTQGESDLEDEVERILRSGYLQVLQLDFPGGGDDALVSGDWPFADGMFHLFGKPPFDRDHWRWFFEL